jgi:hypothetical protein
MILEAELKTDPDRTESEISAQTSAAGNPQCALISVKEAAQRLGVSRSKAYRIDRKNGPFRFVIEGRRIFIDLASFETHVNRESDPQPPLQTCDERSLCFQEGTAGRTDPEKREVLAAAPQASPSSQSASPLPSCGQRDLIMPEPNRPFIVMYGVMQRMC